MIFGMSATNAALSSLLSQYADPDSRGGVLGIGQTFGGVGRIGGPALAGAAFAILGVHWPFYVGAIVMLGMAVFSRLIAVRRAVDISALNAGDRDQKP